MCMTMVMWRELLRTMTASEFRAKCLHIMDEVAATGEEVVITKRGKPVAKLRRVSKESLDILRAQSAEGIPATEP